MQAVEAEYEQCLDAGWMNGQLADHNDAPHFVTVIELIIVVHFWMVLYSLVQYSGLAWIMEHAKRRRRQHG